MNRILYTHPLGRSCCFCCRLPPSTGSWFSPKHSGELSPIPRSSSHPPSFSEFPVDSALSSSLHSRALAYSWRWTRPRNCLSLRRPMPTFHNLCTHENCFSTETCPFLFVSFARYRPTLLLTLVC